MATRCPEQTQPGAPRGLAATAGNQVGRRLGTRPRLCLQPGVQFTHTSPAGTRLGQQAQDALLFEPGFPQLPWKPP